MDILLYCILYILLLYIICIEGVGWWMEYCVTGNNPRRITLPGNVSSSHKFVMLQNISSPFSRDNPPEVLMCCVVCVAILLVLTYYCTTLALPYPILSLLLLGCAYVLQLCLLFVIILYITDLFVVHDLFKLYAFDPYLHKILVLILYRII